MMTEDEWWVCDDPQRLLTFLGEGFSDRKLRLAACAYCAPLQQFIVDPRSKLAIDAAEGYVDGEVSLAELKAASEAAWEAEKVLQGQGYEWRQWYIARCAARLAGEIHEVCNLIISGDGSGRQWIYDLAGNPFNPVAVNVSWLTSDVLALAEGIYQERAFDGLPILADALQDAGCDNDAVLFHCRQPGEHVRGCWVVDLLTGRK